MVRMLSRALGPKVKMEFLGLRRTHTTATVLTLCVLAAIMTSQFDIPLSISSINCNSLNMSNAGKSQHLRKIYGIVRLKTDIILLSDIRLCNKAIIAGVKSLEQTLKINPYCSYKLIHHSRKNSRGVAILYKYDLPFTVLSEERDESDNVLIIKARIHEQTVILCSIYGPNGTDESFY